MVAWQAPFYLAAGTTFVTGIGVVLLLMYNKSTTADEEEYEMEDEPIKPIEAIQAVVGVAGDLDTQAESAEPGVRSCY